jgi:hypothetical protein
MKKADLEKLLINEGEFDQIKRELREIKAAVKYLALTAMLRQTPFEDMQQRLAIIRQLPNLPDCFFDVKRYARDIGVSTITSKYTPKSKRKKKETNKT